MRWAKVFNLKQMVRTMNHLTKHGLLKYAVLEEKATVATARYNESLAQSKAAETRMAEIIVLQPYIINYAKTRKVYLSALLAHFYLEMKGASEETVKFLG